MNYYIWSIEHNAWWGHFARGYVPHVANAGVYSDAESKIIVERANEYLDPGVANECRIPCDAIETVGP